MANALAIRGEEVQAQMATYGGAFGTGIVLGWVCSTRPAWGTGITLAAGAGGAIGALMTTGFMSQLLQGCGAAAMGALGASIPNLLGGEKNGENGGGTERKRQIEAEKRRVKLLGSPVNFVPATIAGRVKSAVEF